MGLSEPRGPYDVGCIDLEVDLGDESLSGDAFRHEPQPWKHFVLPATGRSVLCRLYYPILSPISSTSTTISAVRWLPSYSYAQGYIRFSAFPNWSAPFLASIVYLVYGKTTKPRTFMNAPLLAVEQQTNETQTLSRPEQPALEKMPVVLFSHGLGGMRTSYSQICRDLASSGKIVCALEHRDGTASSTVIAQKPYYYVPQPFPDGSKEAYDFRLAQLSYRSQELLVAWKLLESINSGDLQNVPFSTSHDVEKAVLSSFRNRMDLDTVFLVGHSFGAATSIYFAHEHPNFAKAVVALDAWMEPLDPFTVTNPLPPILFINNELFQWKKNLEIMARFVPGNNGSETVSKIGESVILTLKDAKHGNHSDFALLFPALFRQLGQAGDPDPVRLMVLNHELIMLFLRSIVKSQEKVLFLGTPIETYQDVEKLCDGEIKTGY